VSISKIDTLLLFNNSINSLKSWDSIEFPPVVFGSDFFQSDQPDKVGLGLPVGEIGALLVDSFYANGFYDGFGHDRVLSISRRSCFYIRKRLLSQYLNQFQLFQW